MSDDECDAIARQVWRDTWPHVTRIDSKEVDPIVRSLIRAAYALATERAAKVCDRIALRHSLRYGRDDLAIDAAAAGAAEQCAAAISASLLDAAPSPAEPADDEPARTIAILRERDLGIAEFHAMQLPVADLLAAQAAEIDRVTIERDTQRDITDREVARAEAAERERDEARTALAWYCDEAEAIAANLLAKRTAAVTASVTALSLDAGKRARAILGSKHG